jgi:hypothetical protein
MPRLALVVLISCALVLAGCGSNRPTSEQVAASVSAAYSSGRAAQKSEDDAATLASASQSSAAAAAASSSTAAALHAPKETVDDTRGHKVTYYAMQRPASGNAPPPESAGTEWVAIDVQVCYGAGATPYDSNSSWVLVDSKNGNYQPSSTGYSQFPSPQFPFGDVPVVQGRCVRGWIVYPVTSGAKLVNVAYMPSDATTPVMWKV